MTFLICNKMLQICQRIKGFLHGQKCLWINSTKDQKKENVLFGILDGHRGQITEDI